MRFLVIIFVGLLAATTLLGLAVPIKDDEVFYKLLNGRFFADDGNLTSLFPVCKESFSIVSPALWFIPRTIDWIVNYPIENIFYVRVVGVFTHIGFLGLFIGFVYLLLGIREWLLIAAMIALLSLDVMPFMLDINRPEQNIILCVLLLMIMGFAVDIGKVSRPRTIILTSIFFWLVANYLFYSHAKAFMFLPLVLLLAYFVSKGAKNKALFVAIGAMVVVSAIISVHTHIQKTACDSYPRIKEMFGVIYLNTSHFLQDPLMFVFQAVVNVLGVFQYLASAWAITRNTLTPIWLPDHLEPVSEGYALFDNLFSQGVVVIYCFMLWFIITQAYQAARCVLTGKIISREKLVGLFLLLSLSAIAAIQSGKMFYEAALFIPLMVVGCVLLASKHIHESAETKRYALMLVGIFIISQVNLIYKYSPYINSLSARQQDRIWKTEEGENLLVMVGAGDFQKTKSSVLEAAKKCDIKPDISSKYVMTDMLTYHYFQRTYKPLSFLYLSTLWRFDEGKEFLEFYSLMRDIKSSGMIALCATTPDAIRKQMIQTGDFCCLKPVN